MSENTGQKFTKTELIANLKAMSLEISSLCGANQGLQSDSGFIDENRNDSGKEPLEMTVRSHSDLLQSINYSEKEIISDISSMLTEMNEILDRMTAGKKMRTSDNTYLEDERAQSLRRPVLQALDIRYDFTNSS